MLATVAVAVLGSDGASSAPKSCAETTRKPDTDGAAGCAATTDGAGVLLQALNVSRARSAASNLLSAAG